MITTLPPSRPLLRCDRLFRRVRRTTLSAKPRSEEDSAGRGSAKRNEGKGRACALFFDCGGLMSLVPGSLHHLDLDDAHMLLELPLHTHSGADLERADRLHHFLVGTAAVLGRPTDPARDI